MDRGSAFDRAIRVRRIAGALGAEVEGIDLAQPLSADQAAAIRGAWLEHHVLFFRDQDLTPQQFLTFAERFGKSTEYPLQKGIAGFPTIIEVKKLERERNAFGLNSRAASPGSPVRLRSGTTAVRSTTRSTTTTGSGAGCTGSSWSATGRASR